MVPSQDLLDEVEAINSIYTPGTLEPLLPANALASAMTASVATLSISSKGIKGRREEEAQDREDEKVEQDNDSSSIFILTLPQTGTSLRLSFPHSYPTAPPQATGIHASPAGREAGARDLTIFTAALSSAFEAAMGSMPCIFDALQGFQEKFSSFASSSSALSVPSISLASQRQDNPDGNKNSEESNGARGYAESVPLLEKTPSDNNNQDKENENESKIGLKDEDTWILRSMTPPHWTILPAPVVEQKSVFLARAVPITSPAQARRYARHLVLTDRRAAEATHNISAWRVRISLQHHHQSPKEGGKGIEQRKEQRIEEDYDDDGETAAGGRLLRLLQLMGVTDILVIVSRWYGGTLLGPRRFALINNVAKDVIQLLQLSSQDAMDKEKKGGEKAPQGKNQNVTTSSGGVKKKYKRK